MSLLVSFLEGSICHEYWAAFRCHHLFTGWIIVLNQAQFAPGSYLKLAGRQALHEGHAHCILRTVLDWTSKEEIWYGREGKRVLSVAVKYNGAVGVLLHIRTSARISMQRRVILASLHRGRFGCSGSYSQACWLPPKWDWQCTAPGTCCNVVRNK